MKYYADMYANNHGVEENARSLIGGITGGILFRGDVKKIYSLLQAL